MHDGARHLYRFDSTAEQLSKTFVLPVAGPATIVVQPPAAGSVTVDLSCSNTSDLAAGNGLFSWSLTADGGSGAFDDPALGGLGGDASVQTLPAGSTFYTARGTNGGAPASGDAGGPGGSSPFGGGGAMPGVGQAGGSPGGGGGGAPSGGVANSGPGADGLVVLTYLEPMG
ncbi:hypothetical protein BN948_00168 [Hydrogenophaga intermedia]|uniref:Uncharacterized protein n=1 Tax=Hydrogenophaga intermedia TaxID=65786 RepID=A0A1L1PKE1_HYDIT|nr:hypothetical protein BN948_00168 [Hydrogenophaga intermedia]